MTDEIERYHRLLRAPPEDINVIELPDKLRTYAEELGRDPRRPKTAIARMVSRLWHRTRMATAGDDGDTLALNVDDKEYLIRPNYYPSDFGIGFVPTPEEVGATTMNDNRLIHIACYTSLSVPRPFDPHFHGSIGGVSQGFGFNYADESMWPGKNDIIQRRGGGPRGGFAFTTGPTEGNYPTGVLPQTTFNLGELGFSNGGWYPEGITYTNRPRQLRLTGLRNGWHHRVMFARSRKVMFRNLYGPISTDSATPKSPLVTINGNNLVEGVKQISLHRRLNSPSRCTVEISSSYGERSGRFKQFDTVQVRLAPKNWADSPLVFTGFVSDIQDTDSAITLTCYDTLQYLTYETLTTEPVYPDEDAAATIRAIVGASNYAIPVYNILSSARMKLPSTLTLNGKTRLAAIQIILEIINASARQMRLRVDENGRLQLEVFEDTETAVAPVIGGYWPREDKPTDIIVKKVTEASGGQTQFNVAIVNNEGDEIVGQYPLLTASNYPSKPIVRKFLEKGITTKQDAELLAHQYVNSQYDNERSWTVNALPNRFDIYPGDVATFYTLSAGLSGKFRVFDVKYTYSVSSLTVTLSIGKPRRNLLSALKYTTSN